MHTLVQEWIRIAREMRPALPGLVLVAAVAILARFLQSSLPGPTLSRVISEILIAVLLGLIVRNTVRVPSQFEPGIKFALVRILRLGIILLGLRLSLQDVVATGISALLLVAVCIAVALTLAYVAGRIFKIPSRLATLIGVGTAICGNSAIVATAPTIEAKEDEVSFAVAIVTLFGLIAVLLYPIIGQALALSDRAFGLWAGTAVNDTSQVVAVGAAFSSAALNIATVVKLTRNSLMAPVIVLLGLAYGQKDLGRKMSIGKIIPWFVFGFLAMSLIRTLGVAAGVLPQNVDVPSDLQTGAALLRAADEVAKFSILCALASVGLGTNIQNLRQIGIKPLIVGLGVAAALAAVSLTLILTTGS